MRYDKIKLLDAHRLAKAVWQLSEIFKAKAGLEKYLKEKCSS